MNPTNPCPARAEYEAMLRGRLDEDRAAALEAHLGECGACQQALDGLAVDERLTGLLRAAPDPAPDSGLGPMVARLEDMALQFTPAGFDLSVSGDAPLGPDGALHDLVPGAESVQVVGYRIVRLLGAGGMGLVYLADDDALRRQVAIKVLRPRLARHTRARDGFLREARAMAALKHDNVVTVFQVGDAVGPRGESVPFLAMERLEGETLADWVRRDRVMAPDRVARLGTQAAEGLAAAHARGVVHRDIKPGNLWLEAPPGWADADPDQRPPLAAVGRVKILDFGLAQPAGEEDAGRSQVVLGTPAYMAPEQAAGRDLDARADLFSLGVVLYELLTGRLPFPRAGRLSVPTYPDPVPVGTLAPDAPPELAELVHRLLATDPANRPGSAREVAAALAALAHPTGPVAAVPGTPDHARPARQRRGRGARAAVGAALVAAGLAGVWAALPRTESRGPGETDGLPAGPPDDAWVRAVLALPPNRHSPEVVAKLRELNPGFDGEVSRLGLSDGKVTEFGILTDEVSDIRPVRAFAGLRHLTVVGSTPGKGKLTDLSPIRGLPLTTLNVWQNPGLTDISPAAGMSLTMFQSGDTAIRDLAPLAGMPLDVVAVNNCAVTDLSPVRTMPRIRLLRCDGCPIATLEPLIGSKVRELRFTVKPDRGDLEVLEQMPQLATINGSPASEFRPRTSPPR
ncbi:serine threonine protein partial : Protein containing Serine/threonine protein kinase OS=Rhodopirellula maiorica SM1 GN=RMSM_06979 PE=3 SV=1: Pkinase [Gemmataceae bacterium]|nr:serine threonine protein partial : Protein containing Serine/threonine protein kinase OS=Rhodopirellula maiorica SM1 GN=RMSM_06979 PE=3 SV=1: Pkinase [Gemmataceae bacterium]VTT98386.1 serine threonine protein partial : Protein containing Serine/threonine protein kinase OS=Rhodopirellula maiorica SM1 GN=RMSM_06979 PE=3 SV=1: Pkinase [Gemmataceae bacterium]